MQLTSKLATIACVVAAAATLAIPAPSAGSQDRQAHRGDPSVRLSVSEAGAARADRPALRLRMDGENPGENKPLARFTNTGSAAVKVTVVKRADGQVIRVPGRYDGWAARLPAYDDGSAPARAAIRVDGTGTTEDALSPGGRRFRFGAEFRLDEKSEGSRLDNGDNLVQRGHYGSRRQYKLQVDHRVALCRVKGAQGTLVARSSRVAARTWYRVRCLRTGRELVLKLWKLTGDGPALFSSATSRGRTGSVTMARTIPLSIGGKLTGKGTIPAGGSDQFNGVVDQVVYDAGS